MSHTPTILVSLRRDLIDRLCPGAITAAETRAQGFTNESERRAWIAGHIGAHLDAQLRKDPRSRT